MVLQMFFFRSGNMNISITTDSFDIIFITNIEHKLSVSDGDSDRMTAWVIATLLVLATNIPLIVLIMRSTTKTFLDWMIILDCMIGAVSMVCSSAVQLKINNLCFMTFIVLFLTLVNRFLNVGISVYRFVFILHSNMVESKRQQTIFQDSILSFIIFPALLLTVSTVYFRDNYFPILSMVIWSIYQFRFINAEYFLECSGRLQEYYYDFDTLNRKQTSIFLSLPNNHPLSVSYLVSFYICILVNSLCYVAIYR